MSKFDEAKFRSAAKAAGYSDEEIDAELGTPAGSAPPLGMAAVPETEAKMSSEFEAGKATLRKDYEDKTKEITTTSPFTIPGILSSPVVTGAGLLALGYGAGKYGPEAFDKAKGAYKSVKERMMSKGPEPIRIDPIGFESFADMTPTPTTAPNPLGQTNLTPEDIQARAAQLKAPATPAGAIPPAPAPEMPVATPLSAAPVDAPAPMPSAQPKSFATETIVDEVKDMIQKTPDQPSMQAAEAKAPKGSVKPSLSPEQAAMKMPIGVGSGDNWLFNTLGPEKYSAFIDDVNGGRPFGNQYSAAQAAYQAYYPGPKIPGNIAQERNIARPPTNFGVIPPSMETVGPPTAQVAESLKKPVKPPKGQTGSMSAGQAFNLLGNALGIAGLAQSFKQGQKTGDYSDFGMGAIGQILGNIAPKAGVAFSLMAPSSTNEGEQEALRDIAYRQKVGAGRGTTPASAYQR